MGAGIKTVNTPLPGKRNKKRLLLFVTSSQTLLTTPGGDPMNRYKNSDGWGKHIWTSLLVTFVCAMSTGLGVAGIA